MTSRRGASKAAGRVYIALLPDDATRRRLCLLRNAVHAAFPVCGDAATSSPHITVGQCHASVASARVAELNAAHAALLPMRFDVTEVAFLRRKGADDALVRARTVGLHS